MSNIKEQLLIKYAMAEKAIMAKGYKLHHVATRRGYRSRTHWEKSAIEEYEGRYGKGYTLKVPRWDTTKYHDLRYYI